MQAVDNGVAGDLEITEHTPLVETISTHAHSSDLEAGTVVLNNIEQ